jgi:hypothetical protein
LTTLSTPPPIPPNPPTNLTFGTPTTSSLLLSWSASTGPAVAGYRLDASLDPLFGTFITGFQNKDAGSVTSTLVTGLSAGTTYYARLRAYDSGGNNSVNSPTAQGVTLPPASGFAIRVNSGGPAYTDPLGNTWSADTGFIGGNTLGTNAVVSGPEQPPTVFQSVRWGSFQYQFTVPNGLYNVKLKFAELFLTTVGTRLTRITINGTIVDPAFDIIAAAGGPNIEVNRVYPITVTGGQITIQLGDVKYGPILSGIEILQ